mgnify:CR=1 FL=1
MAINNEVAIKSNKWRISAIAILGILAVLGIAISLAKGAVEIEFSEIIKLFFLHDIGINSQIIYNIRLPRTLVAICVGMNLAVAGAVLQAIMRNPLADPHIIGISSGAGLAGIATMILLPKLEYLITPISFVGAMFAAAIIYILAWKDGIRPVRIILAGVAVSAFFGSGISALMIFYSDRIHSALMWMVGGLAARSWPHVDIILPYTIVGFILAYVGARYLNILQLGDDIAKSLGVNVEVVRFSMTAVAAILAASSVSVVGLLGFVGLIVPHAARLLVGSDYRFLLPATALLGITVITFSDTFARVFFAPIELPVGIIMAFVGAPFFLYLLRREL